MPPSHHRWALLGVILVASALILPGLGYKDLWIDEADSVYFALHPWPALLFRLCDPHPPGYYALLKLAIVSGGAGEFAVRLPSALASILAVAALARLVYELRLAKVIVMRAPIAPWLPAALLAVAPLHIWYAQEARMYALVTLLGLGSAIYTVRLARRWNVLDAMGYVVVAALALLTDQSALLVLLPLVLIGALAARRRSMEALGRWLVLQSVVLLPFILWWNRADTFAQVSAGTLYPITMARLTLERWWVAIRSRPWIALAALGLVSLAMIVAIRWIAGRLRPITRGTDRRYRMAVVAWTILCLYALGTVVSVLPRLYTLKRLIVSLLPYALLVTAWALIQLKRQRRAPAIALALSLGMSVITVWFIHKDPWREVLAIMRQTAGAADVVWVDELVMPIYDYYSDTEGEPRTWQASNLGAIAATLPTEGKLWLIAQANRYRNLFDYYPALDESVPIWSGAWPGIEIRAYDLTQLDPGTLSPQSGIPDWLRDWPSPLDEACRTP